MMDEPPKPSSLRISGPGNAGEYADRRQYSRYAFFSNAEVTEVATGTRFATRTAEISLGGCYVDTLNPYPEGTEVHVRLITDQGLFQSPGRVIYIIAGFGMGIAFLNTSPDQRKILEQWIAEVHSK